MRKGAAGPIALCVVALVLALPQATLARHDLGSLSTPVTSGSDIAAVCGGVLMGIGVATVALRTRPRSRRTKGVLALVSLVAGLVVWVLANLVPPPLISAPFLTGMFTANGVLNAVYIVGLVGSGVAALRFAASAVRRPSRRASPRDARAHPGVVAPLARVIPDDARPVAGRARR